jgi:RNA ligase (TIGR02306 family)
MTERKMATIRRIDEINPIEGADAIELATLGGWKVVVKKGEFTPGTLAIYCEIDSFIPTAIAPFLTKPGQYPKVFEGVEGERLKTVRLRGQLSQGLLIPVDQTSVGNFIAGIDADGRPHKWAVTMGQDVSELLGIVKYEAPIPAQLAGEVRGMFPGFIPKTDQERIQNLSAELAEWVRLNYTYEVTEKLDGSSMTVYLNAGVFGVCSRNLDLKENPDNSLWKAAADQRIETKLRLTDRNLALQGELIGNGIQGNKYKLKDQGFYVFDIYDIDAKAYMTPGDRAAFVAKHYLKHVPVMASAFSLVGLTIDDLLKHAEAKSVMGDITGPEREGEVYKCNEDPEISFKVISNKFLEKNKE